MVGDVIAGCAHADVGTRLAPKNDCYVAELPSLVLRDVRIEDERRGSPKPR
jgi:hypothetical protein